jgi:hypothetical protein
MMYSNNFVVVIKHKGKVLRESTSGVVRLPFGSDYSVLLKNKDSRKAVADIEIDGEGMATGIIVPGNESVELNGALEGMRVNNRFRFIKKTKEISNHRGDRPDDGLVRVEYRFERFEPEFNIRPLTKRSPKKSPWDGGPIGPCDWTYINGGCVSDITTENEFLSSSYTVSDEGITVPGAETRQDFQYGYTKSLETQSHVIILHLRGRIKKRRVKKPITVKTKLECNTCGRRSRSNVKFCGNCGTYLK